MKKTIFKSFEVIIRIMLVITILFTSFGYQTVVLASSNVKGDVRKSVNSEGSITNPGDVELTKTVTKTNEEGIYNVKLTAKGKDVTVTQSVEANPYIMFVLDRSGTMGPEPFGELMCEKDWYNCPDDFMKEKYELAKKATINFSEKILEKYSKAKLGLITFSDEATLNRNFDSKKFTTWRPDNFPQSAGGDTNTAAAINLASKQLLATKATNMYIVLLSDGRPEINGSYTQPKKDAIAAANSAKAAGIEIFTVAFDVTDEDDLDTINQIATSTSHQFDAKSNEQLINSLNNITSSITVRKPAGTNAIIEDIITDEFTYVDGSGVGATVNDQKVSFNIGDITQEGKSVEFKIKIDKTLEENWYPTNEMATIKYTNSNNQSDSKTISESAEVYWLQEIKNYTINYYKDSSIDGELLHSETKQTKKSVINASDISINDYKPTVGYKDGEFVTSMPYTLTGNNDVINVVYKKKDNLSYIVEYYKDGNIKLSKDAENTYKNQLFGSKILSSDIPVDKYLPTFGYRSGRILTSMPYTIIDGQNVIRVCYEKRDDIPYIVKYLEKDTEEYIGLGSETKEGKFEETYTEHAKTAPKGYKLADSETKTITLDQLNKELKFYYEKRNDYSYKVNYLELGTNKVLSKQKIVNDVSYLSEHLENAISIKGYNLVNDGDDSSKKTIIIEEDNQEINFYYTIKDDLKYRVEYYFDGEIDSSKTDYFEGFTYGTVIRNYTDKLPRGYRFDKDTAPLTIDDEKENVIKVYYVENPEGDLMPPKTGIDSTKYLSFAYLLSAIVITFAVRKKEN